MIMQRNVMLRAVLQHKAPFEGVCHEGDVRLRGRARRRVQMQHQASRKVCREHQGCSLDRQHYFGLHQTKAFTDNIFLKYFETHSKVTAKQLSWYDTLVLMNVNLIYKPSKENVVLDALNRKDEFKLSSI